jgi:hypothetical protein
MLAALLAQARLAPASGRRLEQQLQHALVLAGLRRQREEAWQHGARAGLCVTAPTAAMAATLMTPLLPATMMTPSWIWQAWALRMMKQTQVVARGRARLPAAPVPRLQAPSGSRRQRQQRTVPWGQQRSAALASTRQACRLGPATEARRATRTASSSSAARRQPGTAAVR